MKKVHFTQLLLPLEFEERKPTDEELRVKQYNERSKRPNPFKQDGNAGPIPLSLFTHSPI